MNFSKWQTGLFIALIISFTYMTYTTFASEKSRSYYEKKGLVYWDIKTADKVIALTFDDGPDAVYTPKILDLLDVYDAKATFFVVGKQAEKYPEIVSRQYFDGHEIANHTYSHPYSSTTKELENELRKTDKIIHDITGMYPALFRPVGGNYSESIINTAADNGFTVIMWSWHQDTEDWKEPGVDRIVNKVLKGARAGDVVLFHDAGGNRSQTVQALDEILLALKKEGYEFVTVTELLDRNGITVKRDQTEVAK